MTNIEVEKERKNQLIHRLYSQREFDACLKVIEEQLKLCKGLCEPALYTKALILRHRGSVGKSLVLFQVCNALRPLKYDTMKQVGRNFFLLGRRREALSVYSQAAKLCADDWELWQFRGIVHLSEKKLDDAEECFLRANAIQKHDLTYELLGRVYREQEKWQEAIDIHAEALEYSPENPNLATALGLLYLRVGENFHAFNQLGSSLTLDPRNARTILAAGSIMQDHLEMDVALNKYRVAVRHTPNSAQLWNNIGVCFLGKNMFIASLVCLRRAHSLAPFEWTIAYNLGIVSLRTQQYASAFHHLSAAIALRPDYAKTYTCLAVTLAALGDISNSCNSYEKSLSLQEDYVTRLNYAISLVNAGKVTKAAKQLKKFKIAYDNMDDDQKSQNQDVSGRLKQLKKVLGKIV